MPSADEYAAGFGLQQGIVLAGYRLCSPKIGHHQVVLYNEYSYPADLVFTWVGSGDASAETMQALFIAFTQYIAGLRIIRTQSGRPYKCLFQYPYDSVPQAQASPDFRQISLHYDGYGKRIGEAEAARILSGQQTTW